MTEYFVAVAVRNVEWHAVTAASPADALAAYHADQTKLYDEEVMAIDGIRVIERATQADVTIAAQQPTVQ